MYVCTLLCYKIISDSDNQYLKYELISLLLFEIIFFKFIKPLKSNFPTCLLLVDTNCWKGD